MKKILAGFAAGLVFGVGLTIAQMTNPAKVLAFLDLFGAWDPSLAFVMGGAVNGGRFYGTAPHVSIQTDDQVGQGRLLPTTSVDQFAATLARWFGCSASELPAILPNIPNFPNTSLGFV